MRRLVLLAAFASLAAAPAMAQPKPPASSVAPAVASSPAPALTPAPAVPVPSEAARKEAQSLTELIGSQSSVDNFVGFVRDRLVALLVNTSRKPQAEVAQSVDELLMPDLRSHAVELRNALTGFWASHFTVQDLKDLHAFYMTPLGAKLVRAQPEIAQQTQAFGRSWAEKYTKETVDSHVDQLRSRGLISATGPMP